MVTEPWGSLRKAQGSYKEDFREFKGIPGSFKHGFKSLRKSLKAFWGFQENDCEKISKDLIRFQRVPKYFKRTSMGFKMI